jgi:glutamate-1-semialdehyde 2,1-aminomutase
LVKHALNNTQALAPFFETESGGSDADSLDLPAYQSVPAGVSANWRLAQGRDELVAARAQGARVWDVANREFVDYFCGLGTVLLGHANPDVNAAVSAQLELGVQMAATHYREIQLADELCAAMPGMDAVRLLNNSTTAVQTALRVARIATSRELIVRFAGHQHGIQPLGAAVVLPWNDAEALCATFTELGSSIAAVIAEPLMAGRGGFEPAPGFLSLIRKLCSTQQAVFILNESVTGLRLDFQGAIGKYLLTGDLGPDLVICGEALGNGVPIGALAGRGKLMELLVTHAVEHAGTFNGNGIGIAAGLAVLSRLRLAGQRIYQSMNTRGRALMAGIEQLGREAGVPVIARGPGPVFWVDLAAHPMTIPAVDAPLVEHPRYRQFRHAMLARGVRLMPGGAWYLGTEHTDADIGFTLDMVRAALGDSGAIA